MPSRNIPTIREAINDNGDGRNEMGKLKKINGTETTYKPTRVKTKDKNMQNRGRPLLPSRVVRRSFTLRVNADERAIILREAESLTMPETTWIRWAILRMAAMEKERRGNNMPSMVVPISGIDAIPDRINSAIVDRAKRKLKKQSVSGKPPKIAVKRKRTKRNQSNAVASNVKK